MRRKKLWLALGICVSLGVGTAIAIIRTPGFQKWLSPPVLVLPADVDVAEIRASLCEFQGAYPAVPEFVVPAERVPAILSWIRPAEYIRKPWPLKRIDEVGEIVIRNKTGGEIRLRFYWTGKNGAMFTRDGVDQFCGREVSDHGGWIDGAMNLRSAIEQSLQGFAQVGKTGRAEDRQRGRIGPLKMVHLVPNQLAEFDSGTGNLP